MGELKISFTLGERDLRHFRRELARALGAVDRAREKQITAAAVDRIERARAADPPDFVRERLDRLEQIVQMTYDTEWSLPVPVKTRILAALSYLANPAPIIPNAVPGLGYLDDAIMIELVSQQLRHELEGWLDFCTFRHNEERNVFHLPGQHLARPALRRQAQGAARAHRQARGRGRGSSTTALQALVAARVSRRSRSRARAAAPGTCPGCASRTGDPRSTGSVSSSSCKRSWTSGAIHANWSARP